MNRAKVMLFGILFLAGVGGAFATKAMRAFTVYIWDGATYTTVTTTISCPNTGLGCTKTIDNVPFQEYTFTLGTFKPLLTTAL